jgi:retron-type reverse transcriptase
MKRVKRLYDRVASFENLRGAARDALRGKRKRMPGAAFLGDLERELVALHRELNDGSYATSGYRYFTIHEPKERIVAAAAFRDRVVHHAVVRVAQPIFEKRFIEDSFASRPGKGTHAALERAERFARRYRYALKCDIRKYFPSIDHGVLRDQLARVIGDARLLALMDTIIASHRDGVESEWSAARGAGLFDVTHRPRGLPIGNLTSQFCANIYLNGMDHFVKHELRVKGYVRYLDDFVLFGDDRAALRAHGNRIKQHLRDLRLTIHPDKYRLVETAGGVEFVGFVLFHNGRVRVRRESVRRFDRRYRRMRWEVNRRLREPADLTKRVVAWGAHVQHAQSYGLRRSVLCRPRARRTPQKGAVA